MNGVPEKDWKVLRAMKDELLNLACERIIEKIQAVIDAREGKNHAAYLQLWKLLPAEDKKIAIMFDGLKRSNALQKLAAWKRYGLLTDDKLELFSEETREIIRLLSPALHH